MDVINAVRWALPRPALDAAQDWLRDRAHDPSVVVESVDLISIGADDCPASGFSVTLNLPGGGFRDVQGDELLRLLPQLLTIG
jgi:hypothetical protein